MNNTQDDTIPSIILEFRTRHGAEQVYFIEPMKFDIYVIQRGPSLDTHFYKIENN